MHVNTFERIPMAHLTISFVSFVFFSLFVKHFRLQFYCTPSFVVHAVLTLFYFCFVDLFDYDLLKLPMQYQLN